MPTYHVANMFFGQVVVREVQRLETLALEIGGDPGRLALALRGQSHKNVRRVGVADAVVELGHVARTAGQATNGFQKTFEAAALFGDGHGEQCFPLFTHFGAFGHEAQPVEVHVGAAQDSGVGLALGLVLVDILFDRGNRHRA
ncbi:hypothetical protein D9M69_628220 [compost metagenome]